MTQAIFKRENVIVSESYCVDALTEPLIDFISINPRYKGNGPKHAGMRDLRIWQAHFKNLRVPFAVCKHGSQWKLWKHQNVPYSLKDVYRSKGVNGKKLKVKCPKCDKIYTRTENWKGNGTPRFFCPECDLYLSRRSSGLDEAQYHKYAAVNHAQGRS